MSTVAANKLSNVSKTKQIDVDALIDKANGAAVAVDLADSTDPMKGSHNVGFTRISTAFDQHIGTAALMLSAQMKNLWEFAYLITSKPTSDPKSWDWTPAVQAFVNYLTDNHCFGYAPAMTYKLTAKINVKNTYGWGIFGAGLTATEFVQYTDNTPIFDLGAIAGDSMHSYVIQYMSLNYANVQPATNLNANPIRFSTMGFEGCIKDVRFMRGSYGIKVVSGIGGPWGQDWDNLVFAGGITGGAMDWTGAVNGVPNNKWGRLFVDAQSMAGPIFKEIRGYNWVWGNLEILSGVNSQWMSLQAGSELTLGAIKMELLDYTVSNAFTGSSLIYAPSGIVRIGQVSIGGTFCKLNPVNGTTFINITNGTFKIDSMNVQPTQAVSNFWLFSCGGGSSEAYIAKRATYPVPYSNVASASSADFLTVYPDKNERLSANIGDVDYTIVKGDPSIIGFETPLTAQRTVNLPADDYCFNGLKYRVASRGAVNGANTILVKASTFTKGTISTDKSYIEFTWRRNGTAHAGWVITASGTTP